MLITGGLHVRVARYTANPFIRARKRRDSTGKKEGGKEGKKEERRERRMRRGEWRVKGCEGERYRKEDEWRIRDARRKDEKVGE